MKKLAFITSLLVCSGLTPAHANLIVNGGFETGNLTGWTVGGFSAYTNVANVPHSGIYSLESGEIQGLLSLSQTFATTVGTRYNLSLWLSNVSHNNNFFSATVDGDASYPVLLVNEDFFDYTEYKSSFIASAATTTLSFSAKNPTGEWYLDDVSVTAQLGSHFVPEPTTLSMLGLGYLALRISRKNRHAE